jgi:predicted MFS family arabinose efflux permease
MVVAMSLARGVGAALGPILFRSFGLPGPAVVAVVADVIAATVLLVWVRERTISRTVEHGVSAGAPDDS